MSHDQTEKSAPPPLSDMLARYLGKREAAQAEGFISAAPGDVVPFEAAPVQPVDARLAWTEARAALAMLHSEAAKAEMAVPSVWTVLVQSHEPMAALAMAAGNFPQLVRDLNVLLWPDHLSALQPDGDRPSLPASGLHEIAKAAFAEGRIAQALLATGALRLARLFEEADEMLTNVGAKVPAAWKAAVENERAALAWHRGEGEKALYMWEGQPESVPVLFNRGMAALFLGKNEEAREPLQEVVSRLPEKDAWHHLAAMYLTLAERHA